MGILNKAFWKSLPGIMTGLAALIASLTTVYVTVIRDSGSNQNDPPTQDTIVVQQEADAVTPGEEAARLKAASGFGEGFMIAWQNGRWEAMLGMMDVPCYAAGEYRYNVNDVREELVRSGPFPKDLAKLSSVRTLSQFNAEAGQTVDNRDRPLSSIAQTLGLAQNDFVLEYKYRVSAIPRDFHIWMFVRAKADELVMVGVASDAK